MSEPYKFKTILEEVVGDRLAQGQTVFTTMETVVNKEVVERATDRTSNIWAEVYPDGTEYKFYLFDDHTKLVVEQTESIYTKAVDKAARFEQVMYNLDSKLEEVHNVLITNRHNTEAKEYKSAVVEFDLLLHILDILKWEQ